jgi:hypothetical protein
MTLQAGPNAKAAANKSNDYGLVSSGFVEELQKAAKDLLAQGPYIPGKVSFKAELGRIMLHGMDESALAFNSAGTKSNGWHKEALTRRLNEGRHRTWFTKMVTQNSEDIEHVLAVKDHKTGHQLWNSTPSTRTIYAFYCTCNDGSEFILEIDQPASSYTLRNQRDEKPCIWVHGLLRNWDARVTLSQINVPSLEKKYGPFARSIMGNLQVQFPKALDDPHICFGVHSNFDIKVTCVRTLVQFRHQSVDRRSFLDVTEVLENMMYACPVVDDIPDWQYWQLHKAEPYKAAALEAWESSGRPGCWYEVSIGSASMEQTLQANEDLRIGEKAGWDPDRAVATALPELYHPSLRLLQAMDSVGLGNDNRQVEQMVLPRANNEAVPGASTSSIASASAAGKSSKTSGQFW